MYRVGFVLFIGILLLGFGFLSSTGVKELSVATSQTDISLYRYDYPPQPLEDTSQRYAFEKKCVPVQGVSRCVYFFSKIQAKPPLARIIRPLPSGAQVVPVRYHPNLNSYVTDELVLAWEERQIFLGIAQEEIPICTVDAAGETYVNVSHLDWRMPPDRHRQITPCS